MEDTSATPSQSSVESDPESVNMSKSTKAVEKRNRTSGKHSRGGCGTCKIRRVKCDETKPICLRCQKFGVSCDGYQRQGGSPSGQIVPPRQTNLPSQPRVLPMASIAYAPSRVPSSTGRSSAGRVLTPLPPSMLIGRSDDEGQYFSTFRDTTSFKLVPYFQVDSLRVIILQACEKASIRYAVNALGALDHAFIQLQNNNFRRSSTDSDVSTSSNTSKEALGEYSKAIATMKKDVDEGRQDLKTTLLSCLLIAIFESFHGNHTLADAQISNGIELLRTWHISQPLARSHPLGFSSPAPNVVEDPIVQVFGRLEIQRSYLGRKMDIDFHIQQQISGRIVLDNMPDKFDSLKEAQLYLDLIMRRVTFWLQVVSATFEVESKSAEGTSIPLQWFSIAVSDLQFEVQFPGASDREELERQRNAHLRDLQMWDDAFERLLDPSSISMQALGAKRLSLTYRFLDLVVMTSFIKNKMIFDSFNRDFQRIVTQSSDLLTLSQLHLPPSQRTPSPFSLDNGLHIALYYVSLNCRQREIRSEAIKLLRDATPTTGGVFGGRAAIDTVEWVRGVEEEGIGVGVGTGTGTRGGDSCKRGDMEMEMEMDMDMVPEWARVGSVSVMLDDTGTSAKLVAERRLTGEWAERPREKMETTLRW